MGGMQPLQAFSLPATLEEASFKLTENVFEFIGNYLILALVCVCCVLCVWLLGLLSSHLALFGLTRSGATQVQAPCRTAGHLGCVCRLGVAAAAAPPGGWACGSRHSRRREPLALRVQARRQAVRGQPDCW